MKIPKGGIMFIIAAVAVWFVDDIMLIRVLFDASIVTILLIAYNVPYANQEEK